MELKHEVASLQVEARRIRPAARWLKTRLIIIVIKCWLFSQFERKPKGVKRSNESENVRAVEHDITKMSWDVRNILSLQNYTLTLLFRVCFLWVSIGDASCNGSLTCEQQPSHVHSQSAKCLHRSRGNFALVSTNNRKEIACKATFEATFCICFSFSAKTSSWLELYLKTDVKSHSFSL